MKQITRASLDDEESSPKVAPAIAKKGSKGSRSKTNRGANPDLLMTDDSKRGWAEGGAFDAEELFTKDSNMSDLSASHGGGDDESQVSENRNAVKNDLKFEKQIQINYSEACKAMGRAHYKESLNLFESILSDLLSRLGGKHKRVGSALHNVAIASLRAGNLPDAMDAIEEAIKIRSKALGRKHPKVTDSLVEYGVILLAMEQYADAEKVFEGAINLRRTEKNDNYNDQKVRLAKVYNNLGCVYFEQGQYENAKKSFHEAILLLSQVYGIWNKMSKMFCGELLSTDTGYLAMASTLCNTAYLEIKHQHYETAIVPLRQSLEIQREILGTENKLVKSTLETIAYCYIMAKNHRRALQVYQEISNGQQASRRCTPEEKLAILEKIVYCEVVLQRYEKSLENLGLMEDILVDSPPMSNEDYYESLLEAVRKLMGEVNYQVFKYPTLAETAARTINFFTNEGADLQDEVTISPWHPEEPDLTSKLSGHRIAMS